VSSEQSTELQLLQYIVLGKDFKVAEQMACSEVRAATFAECRNTPGYFWEYFKKSCVRTAAVRAIQVI